MIRTAILSVQGSGGSGEGTVAAVREVLGRGPFTEVDYQVVPDEQAMIRAKLRLWADDSSADLVLTLGGIGAQMRHRTPDATLEVIDRQFPGIPEILRAAGSREDRGAGLWRAAAGVRRHTLIVNLPGEARSAGTALAAALHLLSDAARVLADARRLAANLDPEADSNPPGR
ncbi:MAG TPA: molybdopterin-binding protein [Trueperaceae bacterium]